MDVSLKYWFDGISLKIFLKIVTIASDVFQNQLPEVFYKKWCS